MNEQTQQVPAASCAVLIDGKVYEYGPTMPADEAPLHRGWYERDYGVGFAPHRDYFDGKDWHFGNADGEAEFAPAPAIYPWRGLGEEVHKPIETPLCYRSVYPIVPTDYAPPLGSMAFRDSADIDALKGISDAVCASFEANPLPDAPRDTSSGLIVDLPASPIMGDSYGELFEVDGNWVKENKTAILIGIAIFVALLAALGYWLF